MTRTTRTIIDKELGPVTLARDSRARRISIRLRQTGEIVVTVPWTVPFLAGKSYLAANRQWVKQAQDKAKARAAAVQPTDEEEIEQLRKRAHEELPPRLKALAEKHGFHYNKIFIKHNRSNWGSCSTKGNINLNLNLVRLPVYLQDYVMLHELCHLKYMNHGVEFHDLLESVCPNHRALQRELRNWTIKI